MSLVFRNALMPSEDQQALRLRLVYFMRRFLFLALGMGMLLPTAAKSEGTWIMAGKSMFDMTRTNSLGYVACVEDNICGRGYFVDVNSLVERENFRYFNLDIRYLGKYGFASRYEDFDGNGWTVDCDNSLIGRETTRGLRDAKLVEMDVVNFVCSSR